MKLLRLKLLSQFRGLQEGFEIKFNTSDLNEKSLNAICFVGQNGCGKSNVMEVLSEIFYELELMYLNYSSDEEDNDKQIDQASFYGYELEYLLPLGLGNRKGDISTRIDAYEKIKIVKRVGEPAVFNKLVKTGQYLKIIDRNERKNLLPMKIIGYSSGMNELISSPFIKMKFHYFNEYKRNIENQYKVDIEGSRMFYMDYETNALILISNYLMHDIHKINEINEILNINRLHSFRIVIDLEGTDIDGTYKINQIDTIGSIIDKLKKCSTCYEDDNKWRFVLENEEKLKDIVEIKKVTLDFWVNEATIEAFKYYFISASELFSAFYTLNSLNAEKIPSFQRKKILNHKSASSLSGIIPKTSDDDVIFRIEDIFLCKNGVNEPIHYKKFSDGEHQLMQTIGSVLLMDEPGTLFLMDEPETHFNPKWRSKFVSILNKITENEALGRQQELILTTHSPFILSDCQSHNVYKFDRQDGKIKVENPEINTYGASINVLYEEIFSQDSTISDLANSEIEKLKSIKLDDVGGIEYIEEIRVKARKFGESSEKFELLAYLSHLRREYEKKQRG